jgi:hypothetical protein
MRLAPTRKSPFQSQAIRPTARPQAPPSSEPTYSSSRMRRTNRGQLGCREWIDFLQREAD